MNTSVKRQDGRKRGPHRRQVIKLSTAAGAAALVSPWTFQSSRAAARPVKIGMVSPETVPIAAFGEADQFVLAGVRKAIGDGIVIAGEKHPVQIIYRDSQSNPNRAAEVTAQLINNDKVDMVVGSSVHNLGLYQNNADDFTAQITELKRANCEILSGVFTPPEFGIFWTQCAQQGYRPKVVTPAKALLFPASVEALGGRGAGLSTEVWWSHHHPFKSGLTGETALQFCDAYTAATGKQWTQPIGFKHANLEVAIDVLKRTKKLDPAAIREANVATDYISLVGPVTFKGGPLNPVPNACFTPLVGGQWKKGDKFKYDLHVVYNQPAPNIALDSPFEAIKYS